MLVIAGLSLKNLKPRVWDSTSAYFLPRLQGVMVSYADFHAMPVQRKLAMDQGLRAFLGVPARTRIYLDNGAFYFLKHNGTVPRAEYEEFVRKARPDWYPIPQEFIPTPSMVLRQQRSCFQRTMASNRAFEHDGFVPVIHVGRLLSDYIDALVSNESLSAKPAVALGAIVPNLLRAPKAIPYADVLTKLLQARQALAAKDMHVFGMGGTATLHLAVLMGFNSVDSSGWRNRAARGIIQLPGRGDRMIAELGSWRGRRPDAGEMELIDSCRCPACTSSGVTGLRGHGIDGFCNRATHNLWVLLEEANWVQKRSEAGTYERFFRQRLDNSIYLPLVEQTLDALRQDE
jgi:7-cyano-7-deazaguanine tRNA-ribosyltransferase